MRFSASVEYKHVAQSTNKKDHFFTHSEASCCVYSAAVLEHDPPDFTVNFKKALDELPPNDYEKNKKAYFDFISTFGTHWIEFEDMGALYGEQSEISARTWGKMKEDGINIKASAEYSGK